jgi:hypothetical protein
LVSVRFTRGLVRTCCGWFYFLQIKLAFYLIIKLDWLGLWCLTPLSPLFQLYRGFKLRYIACFGKCRQTRLVGFVFLNLQFSV